MTERQEIAQQILALLNTSALPLRAREVSDALHGLGLIVTKATVNSVLYHDLNVAGEVSQDSDYRWFATPPAPQALATPQKQGIERHNGSDSYETIGAALEEGRRARRVLHVLRSGSTSSRTAKAVTVGTARLEEDLLKRTESLFQEGVKGEMVVIAADWGFGKSHMRMLLSGHLSERGIPFVHECIDARGSSLSHVHRSVPRWLEHIQFRQTLGLRDALNNGSISTERALDWAGHNHSDFAFGLRAALGGREWGWLQALGHLYRSPDYSYQHPKAWALVESVATFLHKMNCGGLVVLLDEAENIDKQYDIRGRRKSYETLTRMMKHPYILPVVFVTDRLLYQVGEDFNHGQQASWWKWTPDAKWFVTRFQELEPISPPQLTDGLARELVANIESLYSRAYHSSSDGLTEPVLDHWRRTSTRSIRLLVRLTVNELDLMQQRSLEISGNLSAESTMADI